VPHFLVVHGLVQTNDGYVLLALRHPSKDYFPLFWSASFEEQVEVGENDDLQRDRTLADTIVVGLDEEFGIKSSPEALRGTVRSVVLAVGRECVSAKTSDPQGELRMQVVRNAGALTVSVVDLGLHAVFQALSDSGRVVDKTEHCAWVGLRFTSQDQVLELINSLTGPAALPLIQTLDKLRVTFGLHEDSDASSLEAPLQWHPTSRARLLLYSDWAVLTNKRRSS
jgi:hypothetical protein